LGSATIGNGHVGSSTAGALPHETQSGSRAVCVAVAAILHAGDETRVVHIDVIHHATIIATGGILPRQGALLASFSRTVAIAAVAGVAILARISAGAAVGVIRTGVDARSVAATLTWIAGGSRTSALTRTVAAGLSRSAGMPAGATVGRVHGQVSAARLTALLATRALGAWATGAVPVRAGVGCLPRAGVATTAAVGCIAHHVRAGSAAAFFAGATHIVAGIDADTVDAGGSFVASLPTGATVVGVGLKIHTASVTTGIWLVAGVVVTLLRAGLMIIVRADAQVICLGACRSTGSAGVVGIRVGVRIGVAVLILVVVTRPTGGGAGRRRETGKNEKNTSILHHKTP